MPTPIWRFCEGEPEPGWIETGNNGPIVCCPICNPDGEEKAARRRRDWEYDQALAQKAKGK